jgi:hypothetical protein
MKYHDPTLDHSHLSKFSAALRAVLDGVGAEYGGIHLGHRVLDRDQAFLLRALVGEEMLRYFYRGARPVLMEELRLSAPSKSSRPSTDPDYLGGRPLERLHHVVFESDLFRSCTLFDTRQVVVAQKLRSRPI